MTPGEVNAFGMRIKAVNGRMLDLECTICRESGSVKPDEFQSTRCGSARCASTQGRAE